MPRVFQDFQVFVKPAGGRCNLGCTYCYYLEKTALYPHGKILMADNVLEQYIFQHIAARPHGDVFFSWHGGEPTLPGAGYYQKIVDLQKKYKPPGRCIVNGMQTNGTLIDKEWAQFLAKEDFVVGLSMDGPPDLHDRYRQTRDRRPTHDKALHGYRLLQEHGVPCEILCVVHAENVRYPLRVYDYFKQLGTKFLTFLPLVIPVPEPPGVSESSVPAAAFGEFLCTIFDRWKSRDIGRIKIQIFEEALRTAFQQDHTLCIFKRTCGGVPVVEHNGDFYCCDHYVDKDHRVGNILKTPLAGLLASVRQQNFGRAKLEALPQYCLACEVRDMCNGGCPKNRIIRTPDGETGLNYLCEGYRRFFNHCKPFVEQVAIQWRRQTQQQENQHLIADKKPGAEKTGRNAPCPCGSGKKYKNCCLGR